MKNVINIIYKTLIYFYQYQIDITLYLHRSAFFLIKLGSFRIFSALFASEGSFRTLYLPVYVYFLSDTVTGIAKKRNQLDFAKST